MSNYNLCHGIEWETNQLCIICDAINTEQTRITQLILNEANTWVKPTGFSYRSALRELATKLQTQPDYTKVYSCLTHNSGGTVPCNECADIQKTIRPDLATAYNNADVTEIEAQERERIIKLLKDFWCGESNCTKHPIQMESVIAAIKGATK